MSRYLMLILLLTSTLAKAGPFCAITSYGKDCGYNDYKFCMSQAQNLNGTCIVNNSEPRYTPQSGNSPFCVVSSYGTDCSYNDANLCRRTASSLGGACAVNPNNWLNSDFRIKAFLRFFISSQLQKLLFRMNLPPDKKFFYKSQGLLNATNWNLECY